MEHRDKGDPLGMLDRPIDPPPALQSRVHRTLVTRGLLRPRVALTWRRVAAAAAALTIFATGYVTGAMRRDTAPPAAGLDRYALLLYEDEMFDPARPEAELVAEYRDWAVSLRERGRLAAGEKLSAEEYVLEGRADGSVVARSGVTADVGVLTGLFIIRAASEAEALQIARTSPHLRHGGRVALRLIEET